MAEFPLDFTVYQRQTWQQLTMPIARRADELVTPKILSEIKAFNDEISMDDVVKIYQPLVNYLILRKRQVDLDLAERQRFLNQLAHPVPYVIGIAGSVAVGKSTTARLLQYMLQVEYGVERVALVTTDGFIYPNQVLVERGIMDRKGFPESYDTKKLVQFLNAVKGGAKRLRVPCYSHEQSDVVADSYDEFDQPSIMIIEGVNTLQINDSLNVLLSDFIDLSIYVDAPTEMIEQWYLDRFIALLDKTRVEHDTNNYFWQWVDLSREDALTIGRKIWQTVNLTNLNEYILPTRERANIVLRKREKHEIDEVWLRKF
ncbi:type I pantothenate kinase [Weissella kandleri]|uniref:type I pantothenate kinase n=1 Tax=Weissella kandleri TaxID=1616 RepID=UPI00387E4916